MACMVDSIPRAVDCIAQLVDETYCIINVRILRLSCETWVCDWLAMMAELDGALDGALLSLLHIPHVAAERCLR